MKKIILLTLICMCAGFSAAGQAKTSCNFSTYIQDEDTSGTNIRARADKNSSILKTIKNNTDAVANITGFSNGWFEISSVENVGDDDTVLFTGRGWMHPSILGMSVANGDPRLYAEPKKKSKIVMKLKPDESPLKLIGCQGSWVKVESGGKIGWLSSEGQCGNPLTTCP